MGKAKYGLWLAAVALWIFAIPAAADTLYETGETIADGGPNDAGPVFGSGFLLDNGSLPNGSGRTVSGENVAGGWIVYQPFDVTDSPGWHVTSIGVDGWVVTDPRGRGQTGTLYPDDGSGSFPDLNNPLGSAVYFLGDDAFTSNWRDEPFDVNLAPGRYWFVSSPNDPDYWGAIFHAPRGLDSFSENISTGNFFGAGPTALRIAGEIIPEPATVSMLLVGGLALLRRRR